MHRDWSTTAWDESSPGDAAVIAGVTTGEEGAGSHRVHERKSPGSTSVFTSALHCTPDLHSSAPVLPEGVKKSYYIAGEWMGEDVARYPAKIALSTPGGACAVC